VEGIHEVCVPIHETDDLAIVYRNAELGTPLADINSGTIFVEITLGGSRRQLGKPRAVEGVLQNRPKHRRIAGCGAADDSHTRRRRGEGLALCFQGKKGVSRESANPRKTRDVFPKRGSVWGRGCARRSSWSAGVLHPRAATAPVAAGTAIFVTDDLSEAPLNAGFDVCLADEALFLNAASFKLAGDYDGGRRQTASGLGQGDAKIHGVGVCC